MSRKIFSSFAYIVFVAFFFLFSITSGYAQRLANNNSKTDVRLISADPENSTIRFRLGGFQSKAVSTSNGSAYIISTDEGTPILKKGAPDLEKLTTSIIIPDMAGMKVEVVSSKYKDYPNMNIAPSKGNFDRTINPSSIPYINGSEYNKNEFFPNKLAEMRDPFILRDFRGQTIIAYPLQYNPVTKVLRVYSEITVAVSVDDEVAPVNVLVREKSPEVNRAFYNTYNSHFLNYSAMGAEYTPLSDEGNMLIICHGPFMSAMQDFVDWKILKGIPTEIVDVSTIGVNSTSILNYVTNYYNSSGLTFLLLVGDGAEIPTIIVNGGDSDNSYGYMAGSDSYPELYVGRFSAQSVADVQTQVERTINYEMKPDVGGTWYENGMGIASDQGPGDDNELDYEHIRNIRTDLLGYTYTNVDEMYDGSQGGQDAGGNPSPSDVTNSFNNGLSVINYTGHGSCYCFGSSGFCDSDVKNLTNNNMLPFIWSVACVNGEFVSKTCIAEVFLRSIDSTSGDPIGAVAVLMATINQSWNPPMEGQDEMNDILVESYQNNIKRTFGGLSMNGCMQMNDTYGSAGDVMTDTWMCFGDPSLEVRTATPIAMTVTHNNNILMGANSFQVFCNQTDALVSLTMNGQVLGTGKVAGGSVTVTFTAISSVDTMFVTVTGYNNIPYMGTAMVIPPNGPYMVSDTHVVNDLTGNNDQIPDFGESIDLDVTLKNIGNVVSNNVAGVISITDPYITITDNTENFGNVNGGSTATQTNAYSFDIANNVPDQYVVVFNLTLTDGAGNNWNSAISLTLNAPALVAPLTISIDDSNGNDDGILDPGETVDIEIITSNTGGSDTKSAVATLTTNHPLVTINTANYNLGAVAKGGNSTAIFNVTINSSALSGSNVDFTFEVADGAYVVNKNYQEVIALKMEDFESNTMTAYPWKDGSGDLPWFVTSDNALEGDYCSKSGAIGSGQQSELVLTMGVLIADTLSFFRQVASEQDYDYLYFYIDGNEKGKWSGVVNWSKEEYPISVGMHTFKWVYKKDLYVSSYDDCAWVDNIVFPPHAAFSVVPETPGRDIGFKVYPNPFDQTTTIEFTLQEKLPVHLYLYNSLGVMVKVLVVEGDKSSGIYTYYLDGSGLSSGFYYCQLKVGEKMITKRLNVMH
ncbi:MAG: T9SS type A sorting domain-containing protein [Bacteroidetes bacterium]|nr:T9SS type A sorting domain-containing protein [Bacteroidota bacterium]